MIINKKMRDGSFIELEVDEAQGIFLLKHDSAKYSIIEKSKKKIEKEIPELKSKDIKDEILEDSEFNEEDC